jgi:hypothetical protein
LEDVDRKLSGRTASDATDAAMRGALRFGQKRETGVALPEGVETKTIRKKSGRPTPTIIGIPDETPIARASESNCPM